MRVLFASAEVAPFSKAGGLGDVAGSLPQALTPYVDSMAVITPLYGQIDRERHGISSTNLGGELNFGGERISYRILKTLSKDGRTPIHFVDAPHFFARDGIYTESNGQGFADNNQRFFFFQLVILDLIMRDVFKINLLHCNDHHTGLLPLLIKTFYLPIKTIFTIHNFLYHGHFSDPDLAYLPEDLPSHLSRTQWNNYSALLEAVDHADRINTVSPGYAQELIRGVNVDAHSLEHLQRAQDRLSGIVNGIDTEYWSPQLDDYIPFPYSRDDLEGKRDNKLELLRRCGLERDPDAPVFGSISRLVENKGFPLLVELLDAFVTRGARFVFLGSGDPSIANQLEEAQKRHPAHIYFNEGFNEPLAHLIEAGSDMFLMPSRFEPCGLNQLYSLRCGTIPIVHRTGGLADTVQAWTSGSGTGFVFDDYSTDGLNQAMLQAMEVYGDKGEWSALMLRAMAQDFSWDRSAKEYVSLYQGK